MRKQVKTLEHHADRAADLPRLRFAVGNGHPTELNAAFLIAFQAVDAAQQRAFARPAAADNRDHFAHIDIQIDALEHVVIAVVLLHLINGDERH